MLISPNLQNRPPKKKTQANAVSVSTAVANLETEPQTYRQAAKLAVWKKTTQTKYGALMANKTWTLFPKPPGASVVGRKWIFKIESHANGTIKIQTSCTRFYIVAWH